MDDNDPLKRYKSMRDFSVTPEPEGAVASNKTRLSFVIQKHAATRLHYDFRLELDGTLKSWAVPKGPSFDPADKRMAVHVEDHPLSYGGFEGVIPPKQYGAGTVIVWDRGWWEPVGDPHEGYAKGKLKFKMHGEKLKGGWTLVRMHGRPEDRQEPWLLIKERDEAARPSAEFNVVEAMPDSVLSGRSVSEADGPRSLRSGGAAAGGGNAAEAAAAGGGNATGAAGAAGAGRAGRSPGKQAAKKTAKAARDEPEPAPDETREENGGNAASPVEYLPPNVDNNPKHSSGLVALSGSKRSPLPADLTPQLATLVDAPPPGDDWTYEIKYDGYRILARIDGGNVRLVTRNGNDWTSKLTRLAASIKSMRLPPSWLDGEIVVLDANGIPNFGLLQNAFDDASTDRIVYYVFDIPYHAGLDLTAVPLSQRRALLKALIDGSPSPKVKYSESFDAPGGEVLAKACGLGLEGVVGKRNDSAYVFRRSPNWVKVKCNRRQEFVIVGYTDPKGSRKGIGALLLGVYDADAKLRYAGKVGTGFDFDTLLDLQKMLEPLAIERTALVDKPAEARGHWVKPVKVAEVSFGEWTKDGIVRHPVFHALRTDKPASSIVREREAHVTADASMRTSKDEPAEAKVSTKTTAKTTQKPPTKASATPSATSSAKVSTKTSMAARLEAPRRDPSANTRTDLHPSLAEMRITHPERVIDPGSGLTKLDLVNYYAHAAAYILPHLALRPVSLVRAPSGIDRQLFFQKHSDTLKIPGLKELDQAIDPDHPPYIEVPNSTALVGAAQMNVVEFHTWNSTTRSILKPDRMLFDLDPGEGLGWPMMQEAAALVRDFLDELGLKSWLKTSGGKGLHVVVPLTPRDDYDTVKDFSRRVVEHIARVVPSRFVAKSGASNRVGKLFVDYLRNGFGATTASAWSARARPGLGVSVPVDWSELKSLTSGAQWTILNAHERFEAGDAAWAGYSKSRQTLAGAMKKLGPGSR